jgi:hypothetical protein
MKNYVSFLVSFFFAFILWLIVNLNGEYEENFKAEILVKNIPQEKALKSDYPESINLKVKGQGWKILPLYFFYRPKIIIDLANAQKNLNIHLFNNHRVMFILPRGVQVVSVEPETLNIELDKKATKKVPIALDFEIKKNGYDFAHPPRLNPDSVTITGAESILEKIQNIQTEKIIIEKTQKYEIAKLPLVNPNKRLITLSDETVEVIYSVDQIAEREFNLPVQVINLPQDKEVILFPPEIKVVLRGALSSLVELEYKPNEQDKNLKAFVDYRDVVSDKTGLVKPQVIVPENLKLISTSPEGLSYIIRQK